MSSLAECCCGPSRDGPITNCVGREFLQGAVGMGRTDGALTMTNPFALCSGTSLLGQSRHEFFCSVFVWFWRSGRKLSGRAFLCVPVGSELSLLVLQSVSMDRYVGRDGASKNFMSERCCKLLQGRS